VADFGGPLREYDPGGHHIKTIAVDAQSMAPGPGSVWVGELSNSNTGPQGPLAEVDARSGRVVRRLKTRDSVDVLAVGDGAVWTASRFAARITRIPLNGGAQRSFKLPGAPTAIAVGRGGVWVGYGPNPGLAGAAGEPSNGAGGVVKLDASGRKLANRSESVVPTALLVSRGSVWVALANGVNGLDQLDPSSGQSISSTPIPVGEQPTGLAAGDGSVWALNYSDATITRVDPASGRPTATIAFGPRTDPNRLAANSPIRVAISPGTLWLSDAAANALHRLPDG
jgi:streptogramin lyase